MEKKIKLLEEVNTDNSRFILKIIEAYKRNKSSIENRIKESSIIINCNNDFNNKDIIDLDKIWSKPYFFTNMRLKFSKILNQFSNINYEEFQKNPKKICNKLVNIKIKKDFTKPNDLVDIVDYIQNLNNNFDFENFIFTAKNIDEETLFKEEQIKKSIKIIKMKDKKEQLAYIYDELYDYLQRDFISNKYCDFIKDKCVAQRNHTLYPFNRKNGCCFMEIRKCKHLHEHGGYDVECLPCILFTCPYLTKKGVGYWAGEFVLLKVFLNKKERKHLIYDFYEDKDVILNKILKIR